MIGQEHIIQDFFLVFLKPILGKRFKPAYEHMLLRSSHKRNPGVKVIVSCHTGPRTRRKVCGMEEKTQKPLRV